MTENEMSEIFSITGEGGSSTRGGGQADKVGFFPSFLISQLAKFLFLSGKILNKPSKFNFPLYIPLIFAKFSFPSQILELSSDTILPLHLF